MVLALDGTAVLVNLGDGDLNRSVVLGLDDAVGGRALAGDVTVIRCEGLLVNFVVRASVGSWLKCVRNSQVDDLSLVVLHFDRFLVCWTLGSRMDAVAKWVMIETLNGAFRCSPLIFANLVWGVAAAFA